MRYGRKKLRIPCGAKNRRGLPCQCKLLLNGKKCRYHGGLSTGPKTPEGKARSAANLKLAAGLDVGKHTGPKTMEGKIKVTRNLPWAQKLLGKAQLKQSAP